MDKITILGGGSWGTAIASMFASNGYSVTVWCFEQDVVDDIIANRMNKKYLPGIELDEKIFPTASLQEALLDSEIIFEVIPIVFLRETLVSARPYVRKEQHWVVLSKGIESETLLFPSEIIVAVFGFTPKLAVLSGPNFARQVAEEKYTGTIVASKDEAFGKKIGKICRNNYFRPILSTDIYGVQVGSALKNVLSLFLGILDSSGYSENTRACFLTLGLQELSILIQHYEGDTRTAYGLSGLGDVVLGLLGKKNRNYCVGELIGEGKRLGDISNEMPILPEGINAAKAVYQIIEKHKLNLPICQGVYQIIFQGKAVKVVVQELLASI